MTSTENRYIFEVELKPVAGEVFQPTGFPTIGVAQYRRPQKNGKKVEFTECLLVESSQSMANRLEDVAWDSENNKPVEIIADLPWVEVIEPSSKDHLTSSRTEAHRLASAFIKDSKLSGGKEPNELFKEKFGLDEDRPHSNHEIAKAIFKLDPFCLIHGVFFSDKNLPGQPKLARAVSAYIEAEDIIPVNSGGVKRDHVRHKNVEGGGAAEGYGSVPFSRTEYVAGKITAGFVVDRNQIQSYALSPAATELLETLALWQIRKLLDKPLRLRTACDLEVIGDIEDQSGAKLPSLDELEKKLQDILKKAPDELKDDISAPLVVTWDKKKAKD